MRGGEVWRMILATAMIATITMVAKVDALRIGPSAAGLLYLLPVLWVSARTGLNAGLLSAGLAAFCYNYFLLEPLYTLRIHGVGDVAAFVVLAVVAVVTSRLASDLGARELDAHRRAEASEAEAELAARLARAHDRAALDAAALEVFGSRYGEALLVEEKALAAKTSGLSPLDAAAASWALHNEATSGRATELMTSADYLFVSLGPTASQVLALGACGVGDAAAGDLAVGLARVWAQARDRLAVDDERRVREQVEARDALRRTLLAALGHDFRTPLTILKSGLAELTGPTVPRLGRQVDRLVHLSDDLVASARMESGVAVVLEPTDLVDVVAAALPMDDEASVRIERAIPADLPLVNAEPVMLTHLLGNLLDNAVRHASTTVRIEARVEDDVVALVVRDDGDGLAPEIADTAFERFVAGTDRDGGSGLGLAIARDLALAMGARIEAGNDNGGGACFTVRLTPSTVAATLA